MLYGTTAMTPKQRLADIHAWGARIEAMDPAERMTMDAIAYGAWSDAMFLLSQLDDCERTKDRLAALVDPIADAPTDRFTAIPRTGIPTSDDTIAMKPPAGSFRAEPTPRQTSGDWNAALVAAETESAKAIDQAHRENDDWTETRTRVLKAIRRLSNRNAPLFETPKEPPPFTA